MQSCAGWLDQVLELRGERGIKPFAKTDVASRRRGGRQRYFLFKIVGAFQDRDVEKPVARVVESDPALRRLTSTILRQSGYRVDESSVGGDGWEKLGGDSTLEVLVVGMNLAAGESGLRVAKKVWERNPTVKIIITGAASPNEKEMNIVRSAGMTFLSLPYSFGRLSQVAASQSSGAALA